MGSLSPSAPTPQDLKLSILTTETLYPSEPTERRSMFLSNIDQVLNFPVPTLHFFNPNPDYPVTTTVVDTLRSAVRRLLVPYDFLAGRLRLAPRMEIDCNAAGVPFVVASSTLRLDDLGPLDFPNPAFLQLVPPPPPPLEDDLPLCGFQVTSFKCGGFVLGISTNHTTFDGISFQLFLKNLASFAGDKPLHASPFNDRRLLAARAPPRVEFPHPELLDVQQLTAPVSMSILDAASDALEFKLFHLDAGHIAALKSKAGADGGAVGRRAITSFNVVVAHLWRCKALAGNADPDKTSTVLYAADVRKRLDPPLPPSYTGNAVLSAYARAACRELEDGPFSRIVGMVREGAVRMSDGYARSAIDWGEMHRGFPCGDVFVSSWWRLGFEEVEYPWGKPAYACPVTDGSKDIILLCPTIGGVDEGVNVLISLPKGDMERFEALFYKFLA